MNALIGKKVLVTRARHQAGQMSATVRKESGIPMEIPLLRMDGVSQEKLQSVAKQLHVYDWIIFTSKNGVRFFLEAIHQKLPPAVKIVAVGIKTAQELEARGYQVHFVPTAFVAETFAMEFVQTLNGTERILFPKGNLARDVISVKLREAHILVEELVVYETKLNDEKKEDLIATLQSNQIDVITFTSPSTVDSFVKLLEGTNWREWIKKCTIACIGPITEKEARKYFKNVLVPEEYTIESLIQCISKFYVNA
ncbi:uroporphyrinogen-III synthase [Bacillus cytotoxicus]